MSDDDRDKLVEYLREALNDKDNETEYEYHRDISPKQFTHLPRDTRAWLLSLDDSDIEGLKSAAELARSLKRVGKVTRIAIIALPLIATTIISLIDKAHEIAGWWKK